MRPPEVVIPDRTASVACLRPDGTVAAVALSPFEAGTSDDLVQPDDERWMSFADRALRTLRRAGLGGPHEVLGCGAYGCVYSLGARRVVKITSDHSEAAASQRLIDAVATGETTWAQLAVNQLYCVYGFLDRDGAPLPLFAIMQDFLLPLSFHESNFISTHRPQFLSAPEDPLIRDALLRQAARFFEGDRAVAENIERLLGGLRELDRIGVFWFDLHGGNVMQGKGGKWYIVDIGASSMFDAAGDPVTARIGAVQERMGVAMRRAGSGDYTIHAEAARVPRKRGMLRRRGRYDQPSYEWFIIYDAGGGSPRRIQSGWDYREDAMEHLNESLPEAPEEGDYRVVSRKRLASVFGVDAGDDASWLTSLPASVEASHVPTKHPVDADRVARALRRPGKGWRIAETFPHAYGGGHILLLVNKGASPTHLLVGAAKGAGGWHYTELAENTPEWGRDATLLVDEDALIDALESPSMELFETLGFIGIPPSIGSDLNDRINHRRSRGPNRAEALRTPKRKGTFAEGAGKFTYKVDEDKSGRSIAKYDYTYKEGGKTRRGKGSIPVSPASDADGLAVAVENAARRELRQHHPSFERMSIGDGEGESSTNEWYEGNVPDIEEVALVVTEALRVKSRHYTPGTSQVQALLFDRTVWSRESARDWAKAHGFNLGKIYETDRYWRLRQFDPAEAVPDTFGTRPFEGVQGVTAIFAVRG